jgi:hypothetical protein
MGEKQYFEDKFRHLVEKNPSFEGMKDYELFTIFCLKFFFFGDSTIPFDQDIVRGFLTDGARDGGIDAVFNDPNSDNNDVIIIQSKYYADTKVETKDVIAELSVINSTVKNLDNGQVADLNTSVVTAYKNAINNKEDEGTVRVYFFTSFLPSQKKDRSKMQKDVAQYFVDFEEIVLNFQDDIKAEVEVVENGTKWVEYGELEVDEPNNFLAYEESMILNVSAKSLQNLQNVKRNALLGMNLRYHVKKKDVDDEINKSISIDSVNFWYKNNGILIMCDKYEVDGIKLKLSKFSIVNGGQTTTLIGKANLPDKDFYLQCKVVQTKGTDQTSKDTFLHNIAKATNTQKPIKISDLKANAPEQLTLHRKLEIENVYYITKKGDTPPKKYSMPFQVVRLEDLGKLCLAGVLQMPGSARSSSSKMYNDDYYYNIFGDSAKEGFIADLLRIGYYYDLFLKSGIGAYDEKTSQPMMKNGKTFTLACISLLCKIINGTVDYEQVKNSIDDTDELKKILRKMDKMDYLIANRYDQEKEDFYQIFSMIGDEVLGYCYQGALELANEKKQTLAPSNFLKNDSNYYKKVISRLYLRYSTDHKLKTLVDKIVKKST